MATSKGALSKAAEEAILNWLPINEKQTTFSFEGDPVKAIEGLLKDVDMKFGDSSSTKFRKYGQKKC